MAFFLQVPPTKTVHVSLFYPIRATCLANLTLLVFITRVLLGEEHTNHEAPNYEIVSSLPPSNSQISSSAQGRIKLFGAPRQ